MKIFKNILAASILLLVLLFGTGLLVFNSHTFQTYITQKISDKLSAEFKTNITVKSLKYYPFRHFKVEDILFEDVKRDTLFYINFVEFNLSGIQLDSNLFKLNDVKVNGAYAHIKFYKDGICNVDVLDNIIDLTDTLPSTKPPFKLLFNKVNLTNSRFRFVDEQDTTKWDSFDANNEFFYDINGLASNFQIIDDSLNFNVDKFSVKEQCGFRVDSLKGHAIICGKAMIFDHMRVKTPHSTLGDFYSMHYTSWDDFDDVYGLVKIKVNSSSSEVDFKDIAYFATPFNLFKYKLTLSGYGQGTIANFKTQNAIVNFGKTGEFKGQVNLKGLPDVDNTFIEAKVSSASFTKSDAEYLFMDALPDWLNKLGSIKFKGNFTGFYTDFVTNGVFSTKAGMVSTDLNMKLGENLDQFIYEGNLTVNDFDLQAITNLNSLGRLTGNGMLKGAGTNFNELLANCDVSISKLIYNGYEYQNILLKAVVNQKQIDVDLKVTDENASIDLNGVFDFSGNIPSVLAHAQVNKFKPALLGFGTTDVAYKFNAEADFSYEDLDHNSGTLNLNNIEVDYQNEVYEVGSLSVKAINKISNRNIVINSGLINADLKGDFSLQELPSIYYNLIQKMFRAYAGQKQNTNVVSKHLKYRVDINTLYPFNLIYFNNLIIDECYVEGEMHQDKNTWNFLVNGKIIEFKNWALQDFNANHTSEANQINQSEISINKVWCNDSVLVEKFTGEIALSDNEGEIKVLTLANNSKVKLNVTANFNVFYDSIPIVFNQSSLHYKQAQLNIAAGSMVCQQSKQLNFNQFSIYQNNQKSIEANGVFGYEVPHNLVLNFMNFDIGILNDLIPGLTFETGGELTGVAKLNTQNKSWFIASDATLNNFRLDADTIGDFKVFNNYLETEKRLIAQLQSVNGKLRNLTVGGYYDFKNPSDALNFKVHFDESDITSFQALVKKYVKLLAGNIQASAQLTGSIKQPELEGNVRLGGVTILVDYLKTLYSFSTNLSITEQSFQIPKTEIRDINDEKAYLTGNIKHNGFKNFWLDISINNFKRFQLLNTKPKDNDLFYGAAYVKGGVNLTGPLTDLVLNANFTTDKETIINIPLTSGFGQTENKLITYANHDTSINLDFTKSGLLTGITIHCNLTATPDATLNIILDDQNGDKIRGVGNGNVRVELSKSGQFNMFGGVTINEGDYKFTAMRLISKKFNLKSGGTIYWNGDPMAGVVDITGGYDVRASLANVVASASEDERTQLEQQRFPVECLLYLKGNLFSPDIKFDMNIKNTNGILSGNSASELQNLMRVWRSDNEQMTQQVVSLMLFNRFVPTNNQNTASASGISDGVNNTLSGLVSSQATNIIQKVIPGLDVNVDYQNATASTRTSTILSASKKVFDDRLEFQAAIDPLNTYQNISTQYNLTKDGSLKINAFSRTQINQIYNRNINTGGLGLYYRKEFDRLQDIFKSKPTINNSIK